MFLERVTILSSTTRSKKLQVTGGFYSEEDMKKELNYKEFFDCSIIAKNIFIVRTNHATVDVAAMILIPLFHELFPPCGHKGPH